jgi:pyruvate dehydrogenase E2 component (dihydrolipoamide acetyltransferase)
LKTEIKLPELGENIESAEVLSILVSAGQTVEKDQPLIELETDKATAELPAESAGTVRDVLVKEGEEVKVGQIILTLETDEDAGEPASGGNGAATAEAEEAAGTEPEEAEDSAAEPDEEPENEEEEDEEPEDEEEEDEEPENEETEPEVEPVPKPAARKSKPKKAPVAEDETEDDEEPAGKAAAPTTGTGTPKIPTLTVSPDDVVQIPTAPPLSPAVIGEVAPAAPSVRRLARELGIDINEVKGAGPGGRISDGDVMAFARRRIAGPRPGGAVPGSATAAAAPALPDFSPWGEVERVRASKVRRVTAKAMTQSWTTIPHVTQFDRADITELDQRRRKYTRRVEKSGAKLTLTAITVKILASAMKAFPQFNASYDDRTEEIVFKQFVNIGVAVDTERGLLVPVIHNADERNITEIAVALEDLAQRSRSRKVKPEELQGGTINLSNLGGLGTTYFSPIVAWPQVAVLGLGRANTEAVHMEGGFVPRLILPLSVSYDHRVIDGADAARFLRWIAEALEQPLLMALEG